MIIGQDRTGKTSLKKSLKGEKFNPKEQSTEGIETDPEYFKVSTEIWRTGDSDKESEPFSEAYLEHHINSTVGIWSIKGCREATGERRNISETTCKGTKQKEARGFT